MRIIHLVVAAAALSGCVPQGFYYRTSDGLRADANPSALKKFEIDKAICQGEAAKGALVGGPQYNFTQVELVMRGCMAGKGYIVRS